MKNQLIYDLPTRIFHWLFAGLFLAAYLIAEFIDDESATFTYHMLAGFIMGFLVLLRIIWGVIGTRYSRFASFALHPKDLVNYITGIISGSKRKWTGHNPASSWAALVMFGLALGLGFTGYMMANGNEEAYEDIHELLANGFLVVVLMHVAGIALHTLRHHDRIAWAMVDGSKMETIENEAIKNSRPTIAILFLGLVATFSMYLVKNFDSQRQTLNFLGNTLQLGENVDHTDQEHGEKAWNRDNSKKHEDD